jgi:hypothetical protein
MSLLRTSLNRVAPLLRTQRAAPSSSSLLLRRTFATEPVRLRLPEDEATAGTQRGITKWFKDEGQSIKAGEAVCEVDAGDVVYDFVSPVDGILIKITAHPGSIDLKGGEVIAFLASSSDAITSVKYEAAKEIAEGRVTVHGGPAKEDVFEGGAVYDFLKALGGAELAAYAKALKEDGFDTMESLATLAEADLTAYVLCCVLACRRGGAGRD